jgi:hypothetical protein
LPVERRNHAAAFDLNLINLGLRLGFADLGLGPRHFETPDGIERRQLPIVRQFLTGTTAGGLGGIELGLIGRAIETSPGCRPF